MLDRSWRCDRVLLLDLLLFGDALCFLQHIKTVALFASRCRLIASCLALLGGVQLHTVAYRLNLFTWQQRSVGWKPIVLGELIGRDACDYIHARLSVFDCPFQHVDCELYI